MTQEVPIDAVDRSIIRALQVDGRASYAELASSVGLSPPAVRQRMQRLMESGLLQVVAVTDPLKLGLALAVTLRRQYTRQWKPDGVLRMLCDRASYQALLDGRDAASIENLWRSGLQEFRRIRARYLLYDL